MAQGRVCMAADVSAVAMTPDLGAEIRGVDLSAPLSDACFRRILEVFHRYCVIFLRDQELDPRLLVRFAARFGEAEPGPSQDNLLPGLPQVSVVSNGAKEGRTPGMVRDGTHWHSNQSYKPAPPLATLLYGVQCPPEGGDTEFINMYSVLNALPVEKRLFAEKLRAVHDRNFRHAELHPGSARLAPEQSERTPPVEHPLVRVHPVTGRKTLFVAKDMVSRIPGMGPAESRQLIDELEAFATQPRFIYSHRWRKGDLVVWDNRCTLHRMTPFDNRYVRTLHRIQVKGEAPIAA